MRGSLAAIATSLLALAGPVGGAAEFPSRPIRLIECFPPGGSSDVLARMLAGRMAEGLGQSIVVDNRPGAAGNIGMELAAKALPDGHTMVLGYVGTVAINPSLYGRLAFDPLKDFDPVTLLTASQLLLVVHPSIAPASVQELIDLAKAAPGQISYASGGSGTGPHLAAELFKTSAGVDLRHIPYKGSAPAMNDLLGGRVPVAFMPLITAWPHVGAKRLRGLAVTGPQRSRVAPQIPALAETLPGYDVRTWFGLLVPARTPATAVARLHAEAVKALQHAEARERLAAQGFEIIGSTPQQFGAFIREESVRWGRLIRAIGAKAE